MSYTISSREDWPCQPLRFGFLVVMLLVSSVGFTLDGAVAGDQNLFYPELVPDGPQMVQVGAETKEFFETEHPYLGPTTDELQLVWSAEIFSPLASYVCPHFSRFEVAEGDFVVVRSADGGRSWSYEGTGKGGLGLTDGFWAVHIPGELAIVELYSRNEVGAYGLTIDRFAHGFPLSSEDLPPVIPEAICGTDDSLWAKCYTGSEPVKYDKSRAVARLLINGTGACTGWLVGSEGHVVTNNHCIGSSSDAANTNFEFMAEGSTCSTNCASWFGCPGTLVATSSTLIQTSAAIDYALVQLPSNPTATYGFFQLRKEGGIADEEIYIPQHPQAWGKRIAVLSDNAADPTGYAELSLNASNGDAMVWLYFADTQGGSSGSPVVASTDNMVVALHHGAYDCATYGNGGPEVEELISDLGGNLPQDAILYALDVTVGGLGSGTVASSPSGIDCSAGTCEADFGNDRTVTLTPTPDGTSTFAGWSGDADCSDGSITMNSDVSCTATFDIETHTLSMATAGTGGGTVTSSPSGISCPGDCSEDYDHGQSVTLTPTPDGSSTFAGWSGDADCSDGTVTVNSDVSCTATFDIETHTLSVATAGTGGGTVTSSPSGISCPGDCTEDYDHGQSVTLTPTPDGTSTFAGWSGDADCSDGTVTINSNVSCTAAFTEMTADLQITKTDGVIEATPGGSVIYTIVAANNGPSDTSSVSVTDAFPAALTCSWSSVASGGASGNGSGSGAISEVLTLPSAAAVTYTATCSIDPAATGTLSNSATIVGPLTDPVPGNNTATDNDTDLVPEADLSITKNDGVCEANPGDTLNYSITVANAGPSDAVGAMVNDVFPAELTGCSWTAVAVGGASGAGSGSGNISESVNLPPGSSMSYTATCTVDPGSSFERLANIATIAAPVGTIEPDITDNSSTDVNVGPLAVFGGCFESGGTTRWSETVGEI